MKVPVLVAVVSLSLLLVPCRIVVSENQTKYTIQIQNDGSAMWIVSQIVYANASLDTLEGFQKRVTSAVDAARNTAGRDMTADVDSLTFTSSGSYIAVEGRFFWRNFSKIEDARIIIGDVFQVQGFFVQLSGDGEVYIVYPSQFVVETVSPEPSKRDDSLQSLEWLGTKDFGESTRIVLREKSAALGFLDVLEQNAIVILGIAVVVAGSTVGFYVFRHRMRKEIRPLETPELPSLPGIESDQERTVKLLKSSGGSLHQSAITNQCGFSKAKTSQLLAVLERDGIVRRYKKGRDKIVVLLEKDRSET